MFARLKNKLFINQNSFVMKKITLLIAALMIAAIGLSQPAFEEDFEGGVMPSSFVLYGDTNTVADMIAALFTDPWVVVEDPSDETNHVAASTSWFKYTFTTPADRWMITPQISIGNDMVLTWRALAWDPDYPDGYEVKISTTGTDKADFTTDVFSTPAEDTVWTTRDYDLSNFQGQDIYVAFIQNSTDMFILFIDDIKVDIQTDVEETVIAKTSVTLSPNPAVDQLKLNSSETIEQVQIVNTMGQVVMTEITNNSEVILDVSTLSTGVYIVTGLTKDGVFSEKIMIK